MTTRRVVLLVIALALAVRVPTWLLGHVIEWPDSIGYMRLTDRLQHWDWAGYNAQRTPGYPLLILVAGGKTSIVWLVQLALGAGIAVMLFHATHLITGSVRWSLVPAVAYLAGPHNVIYESSILSETWCTFLTVLPILLYTRIVHGRQMSAMVPCVVLGVVLGVGVLTRPLQAILIPLFALALIVGPWFSRDLRVYRRAVACALPAVLIALGWSAFNKDVMGSFTLSTMGGIAMLNVTNGFVEQADPKYKTLVESILPHRAEMMRTTGTGANVGWLAYPDMRRVTGLDDAALSSELVGMSVSAARAAPGEWMRAVTGGWVKFWLAPGGLVRDLSGSTTLGAVTAAPYVLANVGFLCLSAVALIHGPVRRRFTAARGLWLIVVIAVVVSVAQAVTEGTSGTRYAIPYQPLFFIVFAAAGNWATAGRSANQATEVSWA